MNPAAFDPKAIERFARGMAEGGPIIEELAMKNNVSNPNYRLACFLCHVRRHDVVIVIASEVKCLRLHFKQP